MVDPNMPRTQLKKWQKVLIILGVACVVGAIVTALPGAGWDEPVSGSFLLFLCLGTMLMVSAFVPNIIKQIRTDLPASIHKTKQQIRAFHEEQRREITANQAKNHPIRVSPYFWKGITQIILGVVNVGLCFFVYTLADDYPGEWSGALTFGLLVVAIVFIYRGIAKLRK